MKYLLVLISVLIFNYSAFANKKNDAGIKNDVSKKNEMFVNIINGDFTLQYSISNSNIKKITAHDNTSKSLKKEDEDFIFLEVSKLPKIALSPSCYRSQAAITYTMNGVKKIKAACIGQDTSESKDYSRFLRILNLAI